MGDVYIAPIPHRCMPPGHTPGAIISTASRPAGSLWRCDHDGQLFKAKPGVFGPMWVRVPANQDPASVAVGKPARAKAGSLRDRFALLAAHRRLPWTRTSPNPIVDSADYAECHAEADITVAAVREGLASHNSISTALAELGTPETTAQSGGGDAAHVDA